MKKCKKLYRMTLFVFLILMTITASGVETEEAKTNKVMETKVDYSKYHESGDNSNVYTNFMASKDNVSFCKSYGINMKIYVPEAFMEKGQIWINPCITLFTGKENQKYLGWAGNDKGYSFKKNSKNVTKKNGFYVINAKMNMNTFKNGQAESPFPKGKGQIIGGVFVVGKNEDYKGSIYFDDVELLVNHKVVASVDYNNGKAGACTYSINEKYNRQIKPRVVSLPKEKLTMSKKAISIKEGETEAIKATVVPATKITYESSNKKIATVTSKGIVKGIKKGTTTITVKTNIRFIRIKVSVHSLNKVLETNVDFCRNPENGDQSELDTSFMVMNDDCKFGKTYALNMKIFVPEAFMETGTLMVYPRVAFWTGKELQTDTGWGENSEGFFFSKDSENVTKQNEFYVINAQMPITDYYDDKGEKISFPKGNGQVIGKVKIVGDGDYKGSIYFDDVELVSDHEVIASENYDSQENDTCTYFINGNEDEYLKPNIVSLPGQR